MPALPLHEAGKYVAGAYVVVFALVLIYVAIMAIRLNRVERELGELLAQTQNGPASTPPSRSLGGRAQGGESEQTDLSHAESTPA